MTKQVITSLDQVNKDWLTTVLHQSGALLRGEVTSFHIREGSGNWSTSARLQLAYSASAQGAMPQKLFLKMVNADLDDEFFGPSEVHYYTRDYVGVVDAPLISCYDGAYSIELKRYHLLLDDLSETHIEAADKTPTRTYGFALADSLASLHAYWWGGENLSEASAPVHDRQHIQYFVDIAEPGAGHIIKHFAGELKPHWPKMMRTLFARHPQAMIARSGNDNGFTLIHGDVGHGNILVPRAGDRPLYIIDRQPFDWSLTTWLGVYDLAYALVLDWEIDLRRQHERAILQRYYDQLLQKGILDYSWDHLFDDYRLSVAMGVYIAVEYCRGGINEEWLPVWLPMLQRALTACDDLNCAELW